MKILSIDTTNREEIRVGLEVDGRYFEKRSKVKSDQVLTLINKILKEHKADLNQINQIKVNKGPGSFTGIRVGLAVANSLGFSLKIPVNGKESEVEPSYE